jgi:hypothetical protein
MNSTDVAISRKLTVFNGNYYTDGEFIAFSSKTDSGGVFRTGYFIPNEAFFNSMINIAVSHVNPNYTYWHGHYGTNNSTVVIYITALNSSNMSFDSFIEQTTLKSFIRVSPTITFNTTTALRVKFYG